VVIVILPASQSWNRLPALPRTEHGQGPHSQCLWQAWRAQPDAGGCPGKSFGSRVLHL